VIALAHDLGHPPFGHAGETALRALMSEHGGFEHNSPSLRTVDYLEHPFPPFRGLNLSFEVREGLAKHETTYDRPTEALHAMPQELLTRGRWPTLEAQITCVADRLAYDGHDLEDAIAARLVTENDLKTVRLWADAAEPIRSHYPDAPLPAIRRPVLDNLLNRLMLGTIEESQRRIETARPASTEDVRNATQPLVGLPDELAPLVEELDAFLRERVYHHPWLVRMDAKARRLIERLFAAYLENPRMLPARYSRRIDEQGVHRVVCDYIAGMTDRFCQDDYRRLFEPFERV
jgi:dGTPase